MTTGKSLDDKGIENMIVQYVKTLDKMEPMAPLYLVGIQFVQMGDDPDAKLFLKQLDEDLEEPNELERDIVDSTLYRENSTLSITRRRKILLGAINKKIDNMYLEDET